MTANLSDAEFLSSLRRAVEKEIDAYVYECPDGAIGNPLSDEAVAKGLAEMRASLVEPYKVEVALRDTFEQVGMEQPPRRDCAVVADDRRGMLLLFDPVEDEFVLAQRVDTGLSTFGVRGDAVGCFLAR
ncbi:MAG: hypothetical protein ACHP7P_05525 [Terriglobales bacterium]